MFNFFTIVLIIFIGILLLVFKKRSFKKLINKRNIYSIKLNKNKNFQRDKVFILIQGNTDDQLEALKIVEELALKNKHYQYYKKT